MTVSPSSFSRSCRDFWTSAYQAIDD